MRLSLVFLAFAAVLFLISGQSYGTEEYAMKNGEHVVLGIHIQNRVKDAPEIQKILTGFGCNIKTRIGLHEVTENYCSGSGLIILEMIGDPAKYKEFADRLNAFDGVEVQKMVFGHD